MEKKQDPSVAGPSSQASPKQPRGILKNKSSTNMAGQPETVPETKKSQRWDEMNILATYHPTGKDYGFIKIDEPSTPFHRLHDDGSEEHAARGGTSKQHFILTPELLAERLAAMDGIGPKVLQASEGTSRTPYPQERPGEKEEQARFLTKRKDHYNEGRHLSMARTPQDCKQGECESTEEGEDMLDGMHLRMAHQLLDQEQTPKEDEDDVEMLAPVLSPRKSGWLQWLMGKDTPSSSEAGTEAGQAEKKGEGKEKPVPDVSSKPPE